MPMPIQTLEEFNKVLNVSWYSPEKPQEEQVYVGGRPNRSSYQLTPCRFPCVLPFSQMYPLCCIDIRNFLNQFYFFANDDFAHPNVIDKTVKEVSFPAQCGGEVADSGRLWMNFSPKKCVTLLPKGFLRNIWARLFKYS